MFFWVGLGMWHWLAYNYEVTMRGLALIKDPLSAGIKTKKKHNLLITTVWHESNTPSCLWANCTRTESQPTMYVSRLWCARIMCHHRAPTLYTTSLDGVERKEIEAEPLPLFGLSVSVTMISTSFHTTFLSFGQLTSAAAAVNPNFWPCQNFITLVARPWQRSSFNLSQLDARPPF